MMAEMEKDLDKDMEATAEDTETSEDVKASEEAASEPSEDAEASDTSSEEDDDKKKGKFFKKKDKKKEPKDEKIEELNDRLIRNMAEFDNFRKRTEKEKSTMFEMGASDIIKKLLPIVDNFDRGFKSVTDEELETPFAKGMDMVHKQLLKMLEDADVKPIEALGGEFNPDFHNAVMHEENEEFGENTVSEVLVRGYTCKGRVVRYSMVKVAN